MDANTAEPLPGSMVRDRAGRTWGRWPSQPEPVDGRPNWTTPNALDAPAYSWAQLWEHFGPLEAVAVQHATGTPTPDA